LPASQTRVNLQKRWVVARVEDPELSGQLAQMS
jgi:hypothetical protein